MRVRTVFLIGIGILVVAAGGGFWLIRGDTAALQESATVGPSPSLPQPNKTLIPTINIARATGWP